MTGGSSSGYNDTLKRTRSTFSHDDEVRRSAEIERLERIKRAKSTVHEKKERVLRDTSDSYDKGLVKLKITKPEPETEKIYIFVVDNSGSNEKIAKHLRNGSEYLTSVLMQLEPKAQFAYVYGSDHGDGDLMMQEVDYHFANETGAKILYSTVGHIQGANGHDAAEAFECILWDVCKLDFGNAKEKHLVLVTDQVAHGMGYTRSDNGCPHQRVWESTKEKIYKTFDTFCVVGCSDDDEVGVLQRKFLKEEKVAFDLIDLSGVPEHKHRLALSGNTLLFLVARNSGEQGVELFLSFLYEKWLSDPVFGMDTERRAKEGIKRFGKFLPYPERVVELMMERILV